MSTGKDVRIALTFDFDAYSTWIGTFGATSPSMLSRGEFGPTGVRRLLDLLKRYDAPGTFFTPGHTALAFPSVLQAVRDAGHEIGHHGWVHENPCTLTPDEERVVIEKGLEALDKVTGLRPTGFRSPAWDNSPVTVPLLLEYGFRYESSMMGSDFEPYWCRIGDEWSKTEEFRFGRPVDLVELPVAWHLDDWPYFEYLVTRTHGMTGLRDPDDPLKVWSREFDYLYERVGQGVLTITMHPQVIGRGYRMLMLEQFLDHVSGREGVRFTTCSDYVEHWRQGRSPGLPEGAGEARSSAWDQVRGPVMRVAGKIALVTGAFGGIGKASAEALAREGATVIAADIKPEAPAYAVPGIAYMRLDVRRDEEWRALAARLVAEHGRIDIMVNAAGITAYETLAEADDAVWHDVVAVNQTGLMYAFRAVLPAMMAQKKGSIVTISSIFGLNAVAGIAAYHASKGAVTLMARNAAVTYARHGIRVNSIHPGLIDTPMARARDSDGQQETIALTPLGRIGLAEEVANGVLFLASDEASYITGAQLPIDGGYLAQ